jgi:geranylgeranyl diphosphate synthase type II
MESIAHFAEQFNAFLKTKTQPRPPEGLYDPVNYILNLGGKRIRPALVLMSADLFDVNVEKTLDAALAIEVFHNFSLVHDDIMDDAPKRRGKDTVHEKWDINTGILSGDAMLIWAYRCFESYESQTFYQLVKLFSKTAEEVCVGQQYDMDFENSEQVKIEEYIEMIRLKTAVLVACAFQMGGIIAEASPEDQKKLYNFGQDLGIAFQIQDDLLDVYGDPETFGKQVGGDIIENKKTFLYLKALEQASTNDKSQLMHLFSIQPNDPNSKIETVKQIYDQYNIKSVASEHINNYTNSALKALGDLNIDDIKKTKLERFAEELMQREV